VSPEDNRAVGYDDSLKAGLDSDPEFVQALLEIYRHIEIEGLLDALLHFTASWSGAGAGIAWGPAESRRAFVPLAGTMPPDDPRFKLYARIEPSKVKSWLGDGPQVFSGLGPFNELEGDWPGGAPESSIALPLMSSDARLAGVLLLILDRPPEEALIEKLRRLGDMAKPAIGNAMQLLSMRELIIKDDTASCFNRRHFEEFLPEELARASRFRAPVSLIFLDLDNLKEVNKEHGHSMGSRTLYEVSVRIRSKIRKFDKLFRYGGDEFCIVLPETEWHGAMEVAERVRRAIADKAFLVRELGRECVHITASLGIASFPLHARTQKDLIERADRAMQKIKNGSKNAIGISEIEGDGNGN
jgi:diguanylate cyclase (GGDEF)-like protein